jgi:hypothetical protein
MRKAAAAQPKKCPRGRLQGSENKLKSLKTDAEGDAKVDTFTDAIPKELKSTKELQPAKEPG